MQNDDLIAALGRVVAMLSRAPAWHQQSDDAAIIRALIADVRAGNLVRREDVVADLTDQSCTPLDTPPRDFREFMAAVNRMKPFLSQIGSVTSGGHEGGGDA